ncbi:Ribosomal protein S18 acetylase RimI [Anaerocolumna xylanovorans DSM 12503]|uniref:Ribosomal protein S18 acetylase RimI n=2 Tax=Anaerocolumna TaxID=1843210 RepID=A0A1M7YET3_9FIRM|nr:Ribosomal protein S18 acetylase RimI [Anaerocolumna xylanovorans DSM 12503]
MTDLAFLKNNEPEYFSAFCPSKRISIKGDFENGMNSGDSIYAGYFQDNLLKGFIGGYVDKERENVDCIGPFTAESYNGIFHELFQFLRNQLPLDYKYTFYIGSENKECIHFMEELNALSTGNEYTLYIEKKEYKNGEISQELTEYSKEYKEQLINLHDTIFPGVYISGKGIIESLGKSREVCCIIKENELVGYCVLRNYNGTSNGTIEVLAVKEKYRHQGYGRKLLNSMIKKAFDSYNKERLNLIVDQINQNALSLYYSIGFKLNQVNCAYIIK